MTAMATTFAHFFTFRETLFVSISILIYGKSLPFPIQGQGSGVFPQARFFGKIPEHSEDDFFKNPVRGQTFPVDENTKLSLPLNRDGKERPCVSVSGLSCCFITGMPAD
jgi:hypothetical protein